MNIKIAINNPDIFGALASTLCMIHCVITPFLFVASSCSLHGCASTPTWWKSLDFFFLGISFFAVKHATKNTSKDFMKPALWTSFILLTLFVSNEKMEWIALSEYFIYVPAFGLAILHLINLKYCKCQEDACCVE